MLVTALRSPQGLIGTIIAVGVLVASRVQLDRNQPPGAVGASFDVATHQITTAAIALLAAGAVAVAIHIRRRR